MANWRYQNGFPTVTLFKRYEVALKLAKCRFVSSLHEYYTNYLMVIVKS